jgi:hypothetical protein
LCWKCDKNDVGQEIRTLEYNNILQIKCKECGYEYIDITRSILDKQKKIVKSDFLNKNPYNHHLDNEKTYKLWVSELDRIL